jgi:nitrite reductase (NADH) small subunit
MWVEAGRLEDVAKARKVVVDADGTPVVVIWHEGDVHALANTCIHKQRELNKGVVLHGRIVCPGHQWAFELGTGWCKERERCQPTYPVRVEDGVVWVGSEPVPSEEATWLRTSS